MFVKVAFNVIFYFFGDPALVFQNPYFHFPSLVQTQYVQTVAINFRPPFVCCDSFGFIIRTVCRFVNPNKEIFLRRYSLAVKKANCCGTAFIICLFFTCNFFRPKNRGCSLPRKDLYLRSFFPKKIFYPFIKRDSAMDSVIRRVCFLRKNFNFRINIFPFITLYYLSADKQKNRLPDAR